MTKLSRYKVDPRHMGWFINNLWDAVTLLENKEEVKRFLKNLLTHTEVKMFAKRLQIVKMLVEGYDYQTIKSYVKVGDETISRINNLLNENGEGIKKAIEYLQKVEEKRRKRLDPGDLEEIVRKYPNYFWPFKVYDLLQEKLKRRKKKKSVGV